MCHQAHSPPSDLSTVRGTLKALLRGMGARGDEIFALARQHFRTGIVTATEAVGLVIAELSVQQRVNHGDFHFLLGNEEQCRAFLESELNENKD